MLHDGRNDDDAHDVRDRTPGLPRRGAHRRAHGRRGQRQATPAVPIWYDYRPGGDILVNTTASRRKARLIREAGAVTLVVQQPEWPYRYVVVEGTVVDVAAPPAIEIREAIAARYLGAEAAGAFVAGIDHADQVVFTIRPDRWFSADYSEQQM